MKPPAILLALALEAAAGTTDDAIPDSQYLKYGQDFAKYTRKVEVVEPSGKLAVGTCVLIGPHWALTAAHVVDDAATASVSGNPVRTIFVHPRFEEGVLGYYDIAVLYCAADFGLDGYPRYASQHDIGGRLGDVVTLAGYGATGRISTGYDRSDGLLRAGTQTIHRFERTIIVCLIQRGSSPMEFGIAPGDSGGPLYVGAGENAVLAGIHSFVMHEKGPVRSREGNETAHTRISMVSPWIDEVLEMKP